MKKRIGGNAFKLLKKQQSNRSQAGFLNYRGRESAEQLTYEEAKISNDH